MRSGYIFFLVPSVVLLVAFVGLALLRIVDGPTNILFPALGLVVGSELILIALILLNGITFALAMMLRERVRRSR